MTKYKYSRKEIVNKFGHYHSFYLLVRDLLAKAPTPQPKKSRVDELIACIEGKPSKQSPNMLNKPKKEKKIELPELPKRWEVTAYARKNLLANPNLAQNVLMADTVNQFITWAESVTNLLKNK